MSIDWKAINCLSGVINHWLQYCGPWTHPDSSAPWYCTGGNIMYCTENNRPPHYYWSCILLHQFIQQQKVPGSSIECDRKWPILEMNHLSTSIHKSYVKSPENRCCIAFQPLWKILVNWDYCSKYMEKINNVPNHQPDRLSWNWKTGTQKSVPHPREGNVSRDLRVGWHTLSEISTTTP